MKHWRRFLSAALALVMALSVFPAAALPALAEGDDDPLGGATFAIVNPGHKMAMTAEATAGDQVSLKSVPVSGVSEKNGEWTAACDSQSIADRIKIWTLEPAGEGKYYITTGSGGNKQYLQIIRYGQTNGVGSLQLVSKADASQFTVAEGTGNKAGLYRLSALVTYGGEEIDVAASSNQGDRLFGGWSGSGNTEYHALCTAVTAPEPPEPAQGVSPAGTTIDLFDYWVKGNSTEDGNKIDLYDRGYVPKTDENGDVVKDENGNVIKELNSSKLDEAVYDGGINAGHALKFTSDGDGKIDRTARHINEWSGSAAVTENIVYRLLNQDGYPTVRAGQVIDEGTLNADGTTTVANTSKDDPLDYLFDPDEHVASRKTYANVMGLLQIDEEGYFRFDSAKTSAQLNEDGKAFTIYNMGNCIGFFPFNEATNTGKGYVGINDRADKALNHFFGVHMSTQFIQPKDGKTDQDKDITYDFRGDDDVWVFLDGVLVGDIGGNHDAATLNINFATGEVVVNKDVNNLERASTLLDQYIRAALEDADRGSVKINGREAADLAEATYKDKLNGAEKVEVTIDGTVQRFRKNEAKTGWIYDDDTYHTLDFFYLERGGFDSNMRLKYNLQEIAPTYIKKVDQDGEGLEGVQFNLRVVKPQDNDFDEWTSGDPTAPVENKVIATGETDASGSLTLRYSGQMGTRAGKLLSLADLYTQYQPYCVGTVVSSGGLTYQNALLLELEEENGDPGYRTLDKISLRLENINGTYILRSNDRWNNGVYATPNVIVSAPQEIRFMAKAGETQRKPLNLKARQDTLDKEGRTEVGLFAVVLGWLGDEPPKEDSDITSMRNWGLVHGSAEEGWTITPVLEAEDSENDFSQKLGALIGRLSRQSRDASLDGIAYRFSPGASGGYETTIPDLPGEIDSYYFMVADDHGNLSTDETIKKEQLSHVKFSTGFYYSEAETWDDMDGTQTWRVNHRESNFKRNFGATVNVPNIQDRLLVQRLDEVGNTLTGATFALYDEKAVDVDAATGELRLKPGARPLETKTTDDLTKEHDGVTINGGALFDNDGEGLANGVYYLVEEAPPPGYAPNKEIVRVIVDAQGVHAYAGEPGTNSDGDEIDPNKGIAYGDHDGVSVLVGVGRLVDTMASFGSVGQINNTLTDIYVLRARAKTEGGADAERDAGELNWYEIEIEDKAKETVRRQRKWRRYDSNAALEYAYVDDLTDTLGLPNPLGNEENPSGYLSSSGWNWLLVSQNYWGIYDQGRSYQEIDLADYSPAVQAAVNKEISKKTPLPHREPSTDDTWQDDAIWSDGYTTYGNKILNGLFSGSTTVRFASASRTSLSVTKVVEGEEAPEDAQFAFDLGFTYTATPLASNRDSKVVGDIDLAEPALAGEYPYRVTDEDDYEIETGTLTIGKDGDKYKIVSMEPVSAALTDAAGADAPAGEGRFQNERLWLSDQETLTIENLPAGTTYTVTEDEAAQYETAVEGTSTANSAPTLDQENCTASNKLSAAGQSDAVTFTNTYDPDQPDDPKPESVKLALTVSKTWTGETFPEGFAYTAKFKLEADEGNPDGAALPDNAESLTITGEEKTGSFDPITFTEVGTYTFTVSEVAGDAQGVAYDDTKYTVTVEVTESETDSVTLAIGPVTYTDASGGSATGLTFTNTYTPDQPDDPKPTPVTLPLTVSKTWEGGPFPEGFAKAATFQIKQVDTDAPLVTVPGDITITGNETASFGDITFTEVGTYTFTVSEVAGDTLGVAYDGTRYTVTVTVTESETDPAKLAIGAVTYTDANGGSADSLSFTNTYEKPDEPDPGPDDPELHPDISVTKELVEVNGRPYRGGPVEEYDDLTYAITVKNTGDVILYNVDLRDFAPDELVPDGKDRWKWDELDVGEEKTVEFYAWVDQGAEGRLTNRVEVTGESEDGETVEDQDRETVRVEEPYEPPTPPDEPDEPDEPVPPPEDLNTRDHVAYIIGYPDGSVRPEGSITRAEVATIFFRLLTDEARETYWCQVNGYTDVPYESWFNNAISTLSNMGIVSGYPDGSFRPDAPITRAELTKIAVGFFQYADQYFTYLGNFSDVAGNEWYASFLAAASALGLIEGYPDGSFRPDAAITRAETCTVVNRTLGRRPHKDHLLPWSEMITWPDNQMIEAWYYPQIQEATNSHDYRWTSLTELLETATVENWTEKLPERDWAALEQVWSTAHSAPGGEVMG